MFGSRKIQKPKFNLEDDSDDTDDDSDEEEEEEEEANARQDIHWMMMA